MTRRETVLVVTNREDLHASAVIGELHQRGAKVFRLNTEDLLRSHTLSLRQSNSEDSLTISDHDGRRTLSGAEVAVVYFRRPAPPDAPSYWEHDEAGKALVSSESRWFLRWLWGWLSDVPWFTADPLTIDRAACKPLQMKVAQQLGLRVPLTYYGNDPVEIVEFGKDRPLVVKAIRETGFTHEGLFHAFYTAQVDSAELERDRDALGSNLNFLQAWLPKREELRITWVDGLCLAARIHSQSGPQDAHLDWRRVHWDDLDYSKVDLPSELQEALDAYCRRMGLHFGAFDFVVTPEGEYVFLECNPNGQWLWLDEKLNLGIAKAIAEALCSRVQ
jgi:hypothetical protein